MSYLTEEEARKQVCPLMTYCVNEIDVSQWGKTPIMVNQNCQASACKMAWRWNYNSPPPGAMKGYCGIAGRPT